MPNTNTKLSCTQAKPPPNPKRVAAGKRNWLLRQGLTPEGRQRLQLAVSRYKPWQYSTGPRTAAGKAKVAANGKKRQLGSLSVRELKADLKSLRLLVKNMQRTRLALGGET